MVLIPGLGCDGSVWDSTVARYSAHYQCHILTLAGFGGQPAIQPPLLPTVRDEIIRYIEAEHLQQPVLVGHSLGGFLAFWVAATVPDQVGKVVAVDGVPYFAAMVQDGATPDSERAPMDGVRQEIAKSTPEQFAAATKQSLTMMITDPVKVTQIAAITDKSDPAAFGEAFYELMTTDIRDQVGSITAPVLLIASDQPGQISDDLLAKYKAQVSKVKDCKVVLAKGSRHFIMYDDPDFLFKEMDAFLGASGK
jgi:pimeloyl-ACP methyl ester carboxylesterase